jgi:protein-disulfide isomerase
MNVVKNEKGCCHLGNIPKELRCIYAAVLILFLVVTVLCIRMIRLCRRDNDPVFDRKFSRWIEKNPQAIMDSVGKYVEKQQNEQRAKQMGEASENIKKNKDEIFDEKSAGVYNPAGTRVMVIFFDYNCGHCKNAARVIEEVARDDPKVKVLFRDLPIFGGISSVAAKYSVAVSIVESRKFFDFHRALMDGNARDEKGIEEALVVAKINVEKIKKAINSKSKEIDRRIENNMKLAGLLGIQGTPAMIIGEYFIPGYVNADVMRDLLNK